MKNHIILLLAVGLSSVAAKSNFKHVSDKQSLLSENNDTGTNHKEPSNNNETEQNNFLNVSTESLEELPKYEKPADTIISDNNEILITEGPFDLQEPLMFDVQENVDIGLEDEYVPVHEADYVYNDLLNKDPNEIMDTASGFVPIPIFRRKQKPRRQYPNRKATRRYNRRPYPYYPYSRYYFYPYYGVYRSSSLRFY